MFELDARSLYHMRLVWRAIGGAEEGSAGGGLRLLEAACATALHYADLVHGALADQGYYDNHGIISRVTLTVTVRSPGLADRATMTITVKLPG